MILKNFEINNLDINKNNLILLHGDSEGAKNEAISKIISNSPKKILKYEEKEILDDKEEFINKILSKSLFDEEIIYEIKRSTNKIHSIVEEIISKNVSDTFIIINAHALDKKSKLRNLFEKNKSLVCIPFYPETTQTLSNHALKFFSKRKIVISQQNINLIVNKCNSNREILNNELAKIENYYLNKGKITDQVINKLTNIGENYDVSELVDSCLVKNEKKILNILNENNFNNDDCILIIRVFLNKSKKILKLTNEFKKNNNIDLTISEAKPPIFWKHKEIVKQQIYKWSPKNIKKLIYKLNEIELLLKKNMDNSVNLITDFILEQIISKTNN